MKTKLKILAIDPGENTGYAVNEGDKCIWGLWNFKLRRDESFGFKLLRFKSKLKEIVEIEDIELIVFERPAGRNAAGLISHAKFVGIIEEFGIRKKIPTKGYSPGEIKKHATGNGNAGKPLMIKKAIQKYGYKGADDNEADAICLLKLAIEDIM